MSDAINTITTGDILDEVQSEIPELSDTKQVYRVINRVIRDINTEYPGVETTEVALTVDENDTGSPSDDYGWEGANLLLTLSKYTRELKEVFLLDSSNSTYRLTKEPIRIVEQYSSEDALYSSKYMFARYDRDRILFPTDLLSTENDTIKVKILKDIKPLSKVSGVISSSTTITLPLSMEQVLINGVFYYLYSMPKYSNENLWKINERAYMDGLGKAKQSEARNIQEK